MKELQIFDDLKAQVSTFVSPVTSLKVTDFRSSELAVEHGRTIQGLLKEVEVRRDSLVRPRNEEVKRINDCARELREPLERAKRYLELEVGAFAAEQRRLAEVEQRRIEEERRRKEAEIEAEARAKREAIEAESREIASDPLFGDLDVEQTRELEHEQALVDQEEELKLARARADAARAQDTATRQQVRGTRMLWDFEVEDIHQIPREFLILEVNKQMVLAAARGGRTKIPGLRLFQKASVGFGQNTYVPREAVQAEQARERLAPASARPGRRTPGNDVQPSRRTASSSRARATTSGRRS